MIVNVACGGDIQAIGLTLDHEQAQTSLFTRIITGSRHDQQFIRNHTVEYVNLVSAEHKITSISHGSYAGCCRIKSRGLVQCEGQNQFTNGYRWQNCLFLLIATQTSDQGRADQRRGQQGRARKRTPALLEQQACPDIAKLEAVVVLRYDNTGPTHVHHVCPQYR